MYYLSDRPTAWSVGWAEDKEAVKAELRTRKGVFKVHRQWYHISAKEMIRFILPLFDKEEHPVIRELINSVCRTCGICSKYMRVAPKPSGASKGLWPRQVNDIVCADTFYLENVAILQT